MDPFLYDLGPRWSQPITRRDVPQFRCSAVPQSSDRPLADGSDLAGKERREKLAEGTVRWFSDDKGYGFITPEDGSNDLFIHHSNILGDGFKSLSEGQTVSYEPGEGRKGPEATSVQPQ